VSAPQRILFVWPGAEFSIWDVGAGLRRALEAQGHVIADYFLTRRMLYHAKAMQESGVEASRAALGAVSKQASETVLIEALYHKADLVVLVSGLNFHPIGLWLLDQMSPQIPVAIVLTESPYEDAAQAEFCSAHRSPVIFTNDRASARIQGWHYLPHAFDAELHQPVVPNPVEACDVLMVATGWKERQELLEQIDWSGIKLRLIGPWPYLPADSPLKRYHEDVCMPNELLPTLYASAKICLNFFRRDAIAESLGPRTYELAACGAFQLSDDRPELRERFGEAIPTFADAPQLEGLIRYYLQAEDERRRLAQIARSIVQGETFANRAEALLRAVRGATHPLEAAITT
jgi:spore maturation protein CgeB